MSKYEVQYKQGTQTRTITLEALSEVEIENFFSLIVNAEITEISQLVYENSFYPKDDGDYIKSVSVRLTLDTKISSFKIPSVIKNLQDEFLFSSVQQYIKLSSKTPQNIRIAENFS